MTPSSKKSSINRTSSGSEDEARKPLLAKGAAADTAAAEKAKATALIVAFFAMVVIGLGNKVFQKLMTLPACRYPFFISILSTFIYLPASFAYIWPMIAFGSKITPEARAIPQRIWCVLGFLDAVAGVMQVFAVNYIYSGGLVILLTQAAIPISMVISRAILKTPYTKANYAGAAVVFAGLAVVLGPQLAGKPCTGGGCGSGGGEGEGEGEGEGLMGMLLGGSAPSGAASLLLWSSVMILSCVPMTLSSVYKERELANIDIDVVYFNGWVAVYQVVFTCLFFPLAAYAQEIAISDVPTSLYHGMRCWFGHNSEPGDNCEAGPFYVTAYLGFNICYNLLIILLLKLGSSNILWLSLTVMVPLGTIAFATPLVPNQCPMRPTDVVGLCVILAGLIVYRFYDSFFGKKADGAGAGGGEEGPGRSTDSLDVPSVEEADSLPSSLTTLPSLHVPRKHAPPKSGGDW